MQQGFFQAKRAAPAKIPGKRGKKSCFEEIFQMLEARRKTFFEAFQVQRVSPEKSL